MLMNNIKISNHQPQDISIKQNDNQLIFINGGGEVIGITDVKVNGESVVTNYVAYVIVPTKTSDLINDSGFITNETDPTVPSIVKTITQADIINWNNKQDNLVSGSNIKTINNISLLGSGNLNIGGVNYIAGNGIEIIEDTINNTITSYNDLTDLPTIPTKTSELINDNNFINGNTLSEVAYSGDYNDLINLPEIPQNTSELVNDSGFIDNTELTTALNTKQDTLVSGTNIKTINNNSLLGSGNIDLPIKEIFNNGDFNTIGDNYPTGLYEVEGVSNTPLASTWFFLIQLTADNQWKYQEAVAYWGTLEKYARRKISGVWEAWTKVW